eukprot:Polyplicarium_translucidae@DN2278_c1_g1_i1.p1
MRRRAASRPPNPHHLHGNENGEDHELPRRVLSADSATTSAARCPNAAAAVFLNVYDLDPVAARINRVVRGWNTGAFHAGVEVYDIEFAFGRTADSIPGITMTPPRRHPFHIYRETVFMGFTHLTCGEVTGLISALSSQWLGDTYHILTKNCINFADLLTCLLGVGSVPPWVVSLQTSAARTAENVQSAVAKIQRFDERIRFSWGLRKMGNYLRDRDETESEHSTWAPAHPPV